MCVKRRRNRSSYITRTTCAASENGPQSQRGGEEALGMYRDGRAPAGGWRTSEEFHRHLSHSQPKWRSAWMWRRCNARARRHRAAPERAGGRPDSWRLSPAGPETEFSNPEEDEGAERSCHVSCLCFIIVLLHLASLLVSRVFLASLADDFLTLVVHIDPHEALWQPGGPAGFCGREQTQPGWEPVFSRKAASSSSPGAWSLCALVFRNSSVWASSPVSGNTVGF